MLNELTQESQFDLDFGRCELPPVEKVRRMAAFTASLRPVHTPYDVVRRRPLSSVDGRQRTTTL